MRSRWRKQNDDPIMSWHEVRYANGDSYRTQRVTEEQRRKTALIVTGQAIDVDDARDLLTLLGLIEAVS